MYGLLALGVQAEVAFWASTAAILLGCFVAALYLINIPLAKKFDTTPKIVSDQIIGNRRHLTYQWKSPDARRRHRLIGRFGSVVAILAAILLSVCLRASFFKVPFRVGMTLEEARGLGSIGPLNDKIAVDEWFGVRLHVDEDGKIVRIEND